MRVLNSLSEINILRIIRLLWIEKKISRVDIASKLAMDKSTVTKITSELTQKNIIKEAESGESGPQGGRKPVYLELNSEYACVAGIEINPEKIYCSLINLMGEPIFEYSEKIVCDEEYHFELMECFTKAFNILKEKSINLKNNIIGIGVGIPALVDVKSGKIIQSIPLQISEPIDFIQQAEKITNLPVFFDNDAKCCCYAEKMFWNDSSDVKNMMYVMVQHRPQQPVKNSPKNISVGFGFVLNGKIYHGANSSAGEFRSMMWDSSSKNQFVNGKDSIKSLSDEKKVLPIFKELAKNVSFLVNTLNLDVVYVGGIERKYAEEIVKYIREDVIYLWPYEWNKTSTITTGVISENVVSVGAAILVLDKLFSIPELSEEYSLSTSFYEKKSSYQWLIENGR